MGEVEDSVLGAAMVTILFLHVFKKSVGGINFMCRCKMVAGKRSVRPFG